MNSYFAKIKEKPEHHRRRIAFTASACITTFVFILWALVIFPQGASTIAAQSQTEVAGVNGDSPFAAIKNSAAQAIDSVKSLLNGDQNALQQVNLEDQYIKIKSQVENGDIKIVPQPTSPENGD